MKNHISEYRVYYEDTDAGGIMYHGRYVNWCERARAEYIRDFGLSFSEISEKDGMMFVVRHIEMDYFKPAKLDDLLRIETSLKEMKNSSFVMNQSIFCQDSMLFSMTVTIVGVDSGGKPIRVPERIRNIMLKDQE